MNIELTVVTLNDKIKNRKKKDQERNKKHLIKIELSKI
jgi:hypothetical protein